MSVTIIGISDGRPLFLGPDAVSDQAFSIEATMLVEERSSNFGRVVTERNFH